MAVATLNFPEAFCPMLESDERHKLVFGGAGSGKSYAAALYFLLRCLQERGHSILVVRKVAATLRQSVYYRMLLVAREAGLGHLLRCTLSPMEIRIERTGSLIMFVGIDDPEKLKSINSVTSAWVEEGTELTVDDYNEINRRMRGDTPGRKEIVTTFNPISTYHWIYRRWFVQSSPCLKLHTTYRDNPYIDEAYKAELEADIELNPAAYEVYTLGKWGTPEGRVFQPFAEADPPDPSTVKETFYGLDFGFSNSYTALLRIEVARDQWHVTEMVYERGLTTADFVARMVELGVRPNDSIYADPSEAQQIHEIWQRNFNIAPAFNRVKDGINAVIENRHRIRTFGGNANFNKETALYRYKKDKHGDWLNEPEKQNDHLMDALRYAIFTHTQLGEGTGFSSM